jgi:hypothetical protein
MVDLLGRKKKDPEAKINYTVDWEPWLPTGATIASVVWTVPSGITEEASSETTTTATIQLSGGTAGAAYNIECKITTSTGEIDERTFQIQVEER